mmetsp:Transcript_23855/g.55339  ORF Transcript_23855/g.55339 Transcript_23855/m.55339 type:complete len:109 (+) Transcript_23855:310-636(+)
MSKTQNRRANQDKTWTATSLWSPKKYNGSSSASCKAKMSENKSQTNRSVPPGCKGTSSGQQHFHEFNLVSRGLLDSVVALQSVPSFPLTVVGCRAVLAADLRLPLLIH